MHLLRVGSLSDAPLAAAARFHADVLPEALALARQHLLIVFEPADHTHRGWRLAVIRELARARAPCRVNAVASNEEPAIAATARYLASADGVTGQYLPLDGIGAGDVLSCRS